MATMRQIMDDEISLRPGGGPAVIASNPAVQLKSHSAYPILVDPSQKQAVEHFGVLRTRVGEARATNKVNSILVSSPQPQEGKSLTGLNLAISLAQLKNDRILLIDADLRMRGVTRILELEDGTGLCDFLEDRARFEECIRPTSLPHLYVVSSGNVPEDSLPAALEGSRWPNFLQRAKQEFGLVIVDSVPASAPIADFELVLHACDAVLLVVCLHKTTREGLDIASRKAQGKLLGVVVNNIQCEVSSNYYSYYRRKNSNKR